jgi:hypothetical protein
MRATRAAAYWLDAFEDLFPLTPYTCRRRR